MNGSKLKLYKERKETFDIYSIEIKEESQLNTIKIKKKNTQKQNVEGYKSSMKEQGSIKKDITEAVPQERKERSA